MVEKVHIIVQEGSENIECVLLNEKLAEEYTEYRTKLDGCSYYVVTEAIMDEDIVREKLSHPIKTYTCGYITTIGKEAGSPVVYDWEDTNNTGEDVIVDILPDKTRAYVQTALGREHLIETLQRVYNEQMVGKELEHETI